MSLTICPNKCFEKLALAPHTVEIRRSICVSSAVYGKRNFKKFSLRNKRGTRIFKMQRAAGMYPDLPIHPDVKPAGFQYKKRFVVILEMIPELLVPDLTGFNLKPYVSYRAPLITEDPFTPESLFEAVYKPKIIEDYKKGKILADGYSEEEDMHEQLTPEEAVRQARMTGSDIWSERIPKHWECLDTELE